MADVKELPALNSLVWLRLPCCGAEHPSRVEDFEDDNVMVSWPSAPHANPIRPMDDDDGFFLGWVFGRGAIEVPVVLESAVEEPLPTWKLRVVGDAIETQRRNFVRVPINLEVKVAFQLSTPPEVIITDDLSEGGLRCHVSRWVMDPGVSSFDITLPLKDRTLALRGQVAWWGDLDANERRSVGIRFLELDTKEGDAIRAFVFAAEVERRRKLQ